MAANSLRMCDTDGHDRKSREKPDLAHRESILNLHEHDTRQANWRKLQRPRNGVLFNPADEQFYDWAGFEDNSLSNFSSTDEEVPSPTERSIMSNELSDATQSHSFVEDVSECYHLSDVESLSAASSYSVHERRRGSCEEPTLLSDSDCQEDEDVINPVRDNTRDGQSFKVEPSSENSTGISIVPFDKIFPHQSDAAGPSVDQNPYNRKRELTPQNYTHTWNKPKQPTQTVFPRPERDDRSCYQRLQNGHNTFRLQSIGYETRHSTVNRRHLQNGSTGGHFVRQRQPFCGCFMKTTGPAPKVCTYAWNIFTRPNQQVFPRPPKIDWTRYQRPQSGLLYDPKRNVFYSHRLGNSGCYTRQFVSNRDRPQSSYTDSHSVLQQRLFSSSFVRTTKSHSYQAFHQELQRRSRLLHSEGSMHY